MSLTRLTGTIDVLLINKNLTEMYKIQQLFFYSNLCLALKHTFHIRNGALSLKFVH